VWQLRGRYPNRGYPKIFNDATVGSEAKKLFEEAQTMLKDFVANKRVRLNGIVGFYPANSVGDDIEVSHSTRNTVAGAACLCQYCACTCACLCLLVPVQGFGLYFFS
jgi:cobalamin-dependent methionine synthase I